MSSTGIRQWWPWVVGLVMLAAACVPARQAANPSATAPAAPAGPPERTSLKLGIPVHSATFVAVYLADKRFFAEEGLDVEVVSFNADTEAVQAVAGAAVDIAVPSTIGLVNLVKAEHPVKAFYAGYNQADFSWLAQPDIKTWADLKGKTFGVSAVGSLNDYLTRHLLRKHGLDPEQDVQFVGGGTAANLMAALRAGRVNAAVLSPPFKWQAETEGFTRLGTQADEIGPEWPKGVYVAREEFINQHPNTLRAFLRAHIRAIRHGKANPVESTETLKEILKYDQQFADLAQQEVLPQFDERGRFPSTTMPLFWDVLVATGEVAAPIPEARLLDRRFVDSYEQWAPR